MVFVPASAIIVIRKINILSPKLRIIIIIHHRSGNSHKHEKPKIITASVMHFGLSHNYLWLFSITNDHESCSSTIIQ